MRVIETIPAIIIQTILIFYSLQVYPQDHQLSDTTTIDEYLTKSEDLLSSNKDSAIYFAHTAFEMSTKVEDQKRTAHSTYAVALAYDYDAQLEKALEWYEKARVAFVELEDYYWTSVAMNGRGVACYFQGNYGKAMDFYLQALEFQKEHNLLEPQVNTMNNIGVLYRLNEKYDEAIDIYSQCIPIRKQIKDTLNLAKLYNNLGVVYTYTGEFKKAIAHLDTAKVIYTTINDTTNLAGLLLSLGDAMRHERSDMKGAYEVLLQAYDFLNNTNETIYRSRALLYLGETQLARGFHQSAAFYFNEGVKYLSETELDDLKKDMHLGLAKVEKKLGNSRSSIENYETYISLNEDLFNKEKLKYTEEMQAKYEAEKKESEIVRLNIEQKAASERLSASRMSIIILSIGLLALAGLSLGFYRISRKNQKLANRLNNAKNKIVEQEKMLSISKLTAGLAHEMNNPINYIYNNAEALEMDTKELNPILTKLNKVKNGEASLDQIKKELLSVDFSLLKSEIQVLIASIKNGAKRVSDIVQSLRYISQDQDSPKEKYNPNTIIKTALSFFKDQQSDSVDLHFDENDVSDFMVHPEQIEQCLVNILENAMDAVEEQGQITIKVTEDPEQIHITIEDNGIGIKTDELERVFDPFFTTKDIGKGKGLGLSICYGIVANHEGEINVQSELGQGSVVKVSLPK